MAYRNFKKSEEVKRVSEATLRMERGESLSSIADAWGLSNGSAVRSWLKRRGVDTNKGQAVRQEERTADRKARLRKIARYRGDLCACGADCKARGMCKRCYLNWYKREKRKGRIFK